MSRDLPRLLHDTAVEPLAEPDVGGLVRRGRRRRRWRHTAAGAGAVMVLVAGVLLGTTALTDPAPPEIVDQPPSSSPSEAPPTETPADGDAGLNGLEMSTLPAMGAAGVAVDVGGAVEFVAADGTEYGRLDGWTIDTGMPGGPVSGPVALYHQGDNRSVWAAPATGNVRDENDEDGERLWAPIAGAGEIVERPSATDPAPVHLVSVGETVASFSVMGPYAISDGHRVVSWTDCPADAGADLAGCVWRAYDVDMGGQVELPAGCQVADAFGDFKLLLNCSRFWEQADGRSWLQLQGPTADGARQIDAPGPDGRFTNAFLVGDRIVATWETPSDEGGCRTRQVVSVLPDATRPSPLQATGGAGSAMVIGTRGDAAIIAQTQAACFAGEPATGQVRMVDADGDDTVLYDGPLVTAKVWDSTDVAAQGMPNEDPATDPSLAGTIIASMPHLAEIDAATGDAVRELDAPIGEGSVRLAVTPDGAVVYHEELWTGCATRLHRTDLETGESELLGTGLLPDVAPDGTKLAYVSYEPCVHDNQALTIRDLDSGEEHTIALHQPQDRRARITGLSWAPDSQRIAVEVGYAQRRDNTIAAPTTYDIWVIDTTSPHNRAIGDQPGGQARGTYIYPGPSGVVYRHPTFRGDRGTLMVAAYCCGDHETDTSMTERLQRPDRVDILELDPTTGESLGELVTTNSPVTDLASDTTGTHVLYVETQPKQPGVHSQQDVLKLLTEGELFTVIEGASSAAWRTGARDG